MGAEPEEAEPSRLQLKPLLARACPVAPLLNRKAEAGPGGKAPRAEQRLRRVVSSSPARAPHEGAGASGRGDGGTRQPAVNRDLFSPLERYQRSRRERERGERCPGRLVSLLSAWPPLFPVKRIPPLTGTSRT